MMLILIIKGILAHVHGRIPKGEREKEGRRGELKLVFSNNKSLNSFHPQLVPSKPSC